jgi:hypothetical protein
MLIELSSAEKQRVCLSCEHQNNLDICSICSRNPHHENKFVNKTVMHMQKKYFCTAYSVIERKRCAYYLVGENDDCCYRVKFTNNECNYYEEKFVSKETHK